MTNPNKMTEKIKVPLSPVLKELGLHQTAEFPAEKYYTVGATIQRISTETAKRFTQSKNRENNTVTVTRTA